MVDGNLVNKDNDTHDIVSRRHPREVMTTLSKRPDAKFESDPDFIFVPCGICRDEELLTALWILKLNHLSKTATYKVLQETALTEFVSHVINYARNFDKGI